MAFFDGQGLGDINLPEVEAGISEAAARMTPEQIAAFRQEFGMEPGPTGMLPTPEEVAEFQRAFGVGTPRDQANPPDDTPAEEETPPETQDLGFQPRQDARNTIRAALTTFGLEDLADVVYGEYTAERVNIANPDAVLFSIRNTAQYQKRFAANAKRAAKGLPELDPASYLALENQYRDIMRANGLPVGFYDQTSDFEKLIEGDVSALELSGRITEGYRRVADADPQVKQQMRELYNVDEAGLAAYFLDPERAAPLLQRQATAATIAARGREQANLRLTATTAEELASRGITGQEAQDTFARMGQLAGLYQEMGGEEALTEQQKVGAAFGFDIQAQQELERRRAQRVGEFQTGGGFTRTTGATSRTIVTGAGEAQ